MRCMRACVCWRGGDVEGDVCHNVLRAQFSTCLACAHASHVDLHLTIFRLVVVVVVVVFVADAEVAAVAVVVVVARMMSLL